MILTSPNFKNNEKIPVQFTGDGQNINPELEIKEIPNNTESFVLIVEDPDAPVGTWDHWIIFNIPKEIKRILKNSVPESGVLGQNSWGRNNYEGPSPPSGTHRYLFKIFALDTKLWLNNGASKKEIETAMKKHVLDRAELIGKYR